MYFLQRGHEVARLSKAHLWHTVQLESQLTCCQEHILQLECAQSQFTLQAQQQAQQLEEANAQVAALSADMAGLHARVQEYASECHTQQQHAVVLERELAAMSVAVQQEADAVQVADAAAAAVAADTQEQHSNWLQLLPPLMVSLWLLLGCAANVHRYIHVLMP